MLLEYHNVVFFLDSLYRSTGRAIAVDMASVSALGFVKVFGESLDGSSTYLP